MKYLVIQGIDAGSGSAVYDQSGGRVYAADFCKESVFLVRISVAFY